MVAIRLENFGGMVPLASRRLLPDNMAATATNAFLRSGEIRGIRGAQVLRAIVPVVQAYINGVLIPESDYEFVDSETIQFLIAVGVDSPVDIIMHSAHNGVTAVPYTRSRFTAYAGQTSFPATYTVGAVSVFVNGVLLPDTEYTSSSGTAIVLDLAATAGDVVEIIAHNTSAVIAFGPSGTETTAYSRVEHTATAGQTSFAATYTEGMELVYVNGVLLPPSDYTATSETAIVLDTPAELDDTVVIIKRTESGTPFTNISARYTRTTTIASGGESLFAIDPVLGTYQKAVRIPDPTAPDGVVWYYFTSRFADFSANPLANDAYDRYIWLDGNAPGTAVQPMQNSLARIKNGDPPIQLGVPSPEAAPTLGSTGGSVTAVTRSYVYTYVNLFGEEGPPSDAATHSAYANSTWNLTALVDPSFADTYGITLLRIYRTITGATGTSFFLVAEQVVTDATYDDTRTDSAVALDGIILQSTTWAPPETMEGLIELPNGFFAGWRGRDIMFSEPYRPWAWPAEYVLSATYDVLECGVVDQTLVALTATTPVFITGTSPVTMTMSRTALIEPCLAAVSVAQAPGGLFFAGASGLMLVTPSGIVPITQDIVSRETWTNLYVPRIAAAAVFDSQYVVMGENGDGFVFDPRALQSGVIDIVNFESVTNIWCDPYTAEAHLMIANKVCLWSAPTAEFSVAEWISKEFQLARPINFGAFKVFMDPRYTVDTSLSVVGLGSLETVPEGGPWPEYTSIVNYNLANGAAINAVPEDGDYPPGNSAPVEAWPYWFGVQLDTSYATVPDGPYCVVTILAGTRIVWQGAAESGHVYRLPSGFKSDIWQFQIRTKAPVMNLQIAQTAKELADV